MSVPATRPPAGKKHPKWPWIAAAVAAVVIIGSISATTEPKPALTADATSLDTAPVRTTDPAAAAAERSRYEEAAKASSEVAEQSSKAAASSAAAAEAQRKAEEEADRKARRITYSVTTTGSGISMITYLKPDFDMSQETGVRGKKWSKTIDGEGDTLGINMNAQNAGGGTISCRISRGDGSVIAENSSSGPYAVVSCG
ncbi:MmpS family transport accessory protein [Amycolatopsis sp. OK19-0408]|uniref:MmpS family transport accessory protein n=1 Tax=Amycolatopsis iheyensis TaxID=2945988 RepID=A0A9X2NJW5_9PSEU|nr:MmpS family transport accessory protein [Amycolatopsis iheyensis]MCR6488135.1 MmpS family transport accessory protein [Amycolatopsis iheyensis]